MLVQTPSLYLTENVLEFVARNRLINEFLAAGEFGEIPITIGEFGRHRIYPELEVSRQIGLQRLFSTLQSSEVSIHHVLRCPFIDPPQRMKRIFDYLLETEFIGHVNLRWQQASSLDLAIEKRLQTGAKAANVFGDDILEREILLESPRHIKMATRA